MLPLDSPRWTEIQGSDDGLVELLRRLPELDEDEQGALFGGYVMHQGDVSHATFAALPHVWAARHRVDDEYASALLSLCACAVNTGFDPTYLPPDLAAHYLSWLTAARTEATASLEPTCDRDDVLRLLAIVGAGTRVGQLLAELADDNLTLQCPCGKPFFVERRDTALAVVDGAPLVPATAHTLSTCARELFDLATQRELIVITRHILALAGRCRCPHCGTNSDVIDEEFGELEA